MGMTEQDTTEAPRFLTTREVAELLRVRERKVYDLAAEGAIPCRRVTGKLLFPRAEIEAWLAGAAMPAPPAPRPAEPARPLPAVIAGSHDPLLDWAIRESGSRLATLFDGSLDGLARLAAGEAVAAGLHVHEPDTGGWNIGHVKGAFGDAPVVLIGWARRSQGLILATGLEGRISGAADLAGHRVVQRQATAGAGILLAHQMAEAGLGRDDVRFIGGLARTETEAAAAVAAGHADAAPGIASVARQFGLPFVALSEERYDLVVDRRGWFEPPMQALLAFARTEAFAAKARDLGGYDISGLGSVRWNGP
jgi:excisionase family DNA binding protein